MKWRVSEEGKCAGGVSEGRLSSEEEEEEEEEDRAMWYIGKDYVKEMKKGKRIWKGR